ncbi:lytic murein transglycosylase [Ideonella sp. YS5]|uniref:lytic murein transglycosylase n=1 Tax=Ideonella sp. YS5 TaxID=3453714 RepID=UPI003EED745B
MTSRIAFTLVVLAGLASCATETSVPAPPAAASAAAAGSEDGPQRRFADWVAALRESARAAGIDEATLHLALDDVHYLPQLIERDRAQPEFTRTPWAYLDSAVSAPRITLGQDKLAQVREEAAAAAARHGVPPSIVVAIWGIESNYGSQYGDIPTIDALATLGFEGRREKWARGELIAAMKILQGGDIGRERMVGSWAGAMGQTQFLPSVFLAYAVDADGDGRRDIWGSMADVVSSTANFLARSGWRAGEPWGVEVQLPPGFDVGRADGMLRQPAAQWAAEGVRAMGDATLPEIADGAILLPAGARGPAFLVGANFRTLLRYNNSVNYALAVGVLSQRLEGGPGVQAAWPRELPPISRTQVLQMQETLARRGFDSGPADGVMGPATRDALRRYQRSAGLPPDGYPTPELMDRLLEPGDSPPR